MSDKLMMSVVHFSQKVALVEYFTFFRQLILIILITIIMN